MTENLKPCPFCGGKAVLNTGYPMGLWTVRCNECRGKISRYHSRKEAEAAWNRRIYDEDDE